MKYAKHPPRSRQMILLPATLAVGLLVSLPPSTFAQQRRGGETSDDYSDDYSDEESMDEYSYSSGSRSGSAGPANLNESYRNDLVSKLQNIDYATLLMPNNLIQVDDSPILKKEAEQAFLAGNQPLAMDLMFGYMVAEYEKATVDLQRVKYSPILRRPVWQARWGVSMAVRGEVAADPNPIREGATPAGGGRVAARGQAGQESVEDLAGTEDFEDDGSSRMEMRAMGQGYGRPMGNRISNAPTTSMLGEEAEQELDKTLGLVAEIVGTEFQKRYQQGDFGPALSNVSPPPPPLAAAGGIGMRPLAAAAAPAFTQAVSDALADSSEPPPMWRPGIVYLGQGDSDEILELAKSEQIDFLLHFDVFLKAGRSDWIQNTSRCRILQVANGKVLGASKGIDSLDAARLVQSGRGGERSYVEEQLENLFAIMDRQTKASDLPKLSPEIAESRVTALIATSSGRGALRTLAEVRLYQAQGLIDESVVETVFNILGGEDALTMLHGALEDRLTTARKWAVRAQNREVDTASF